jgi:hypothetical protein
MAALNEKTPPCSQDSEVLSDVEGDGSMAVIPQHQLNEVPKRGNDRKISGLT